MRKVAGDKAADGFLDRPSGAYPRTRVSTAERKRRGVAMEGYWTRQSTNTRDRATAMMPRLLYDRLDAGIDFCIVYPISPASAFRAHPRCRDRCALFCGFNIVTAEYFAKLK